MDLETEPDCNFYYSVEEMEEDKVSFDRMMLLKDKFKTDEFAYKLRTMLIRSIMMVFSFIGVIAFFTYNSDIITTFPLQNANYLLQSVFLLVVSGVLICFMSLFYNELVFLWGVYHENHETFEFVEEEFIPWKQVIFVGLYILLTISTFIMFAQAHEGFTMNPSACETVDRCRSIFANYTILFLVGIIAMVVCITHFTELKTIN